MHTSDELLTELKALHPRRMDLSLGRIEALLAKLGNPQHRLPPVIHIAGTNGKGSTAALLKAMLQAAGKRVHVYTSPHLVRFHERIELAGTDGKARPIGEAELVELLERTRRVNDGGPVTFFEITTAAAFQAFTEHPADAVILEVCDDGDGFEPLGAFPGHLGLRSMRERVDHLGGMLRIESAPGQGTHLRTQVPLGRPLGDATGLPLAF